MSASDQSPVQKVEDSKPVVWTPEDASRFLTSAIQEAQRPLSDELKDRPVTSKWLTIIIAAMVVIALGVALILSSHLERAERTHSAQLQEVDKKLEAVRTAREEVLAEKLQLQSSAGALEDRLATTRERAQQLQQQLEGMRGGEDELKRTKSDLQRFRRQNELLRSQISGLEMEKVALARQLDAVRAMALDEAEDGDLDEPVDVGVPPETRPAAAVEQAAEPPAAPAAPAVSVVAEPEEEPAPLAPTPTPTQPEVVAAPVTGTDEPESRSSFQAASEAFGSQLAKERADGGDDEAIKVEDVAEDEPEPAEAPAAAAGDSETAASTAATPAEEAADEPAAEPENASDDDASTREDVEEEEGERAPEY